MRLHPLWLVGLVACSSEVTVDGDGEGGGAEVGELDPLTEAVSPPGVATWEERHTRGTCGWDLDEHVDGSIDDAEIIQTEPNGDILRLHDYAADGVVDSVVRSFVDERGLVVRRESGTPSEVGWVYSFTYDAAGRRTLEEVDQDGSLPPNGEVNYSHSYGYDALSRLSSITTVSYDGTGSESVATYAYDDDGLGFSVSRGSLASQVVDVWSITLDELGRLALIVKAYGSVGLGDNSWSYQYDASGRRERMIASIGDGPRHFIYGYDEQGRLSTIDFDHPAGGAIESRWTYHYDCE